MAGPCLIHRTSECETLSNIRLTGEAGALNEAIRRLTNEGGDGKLLRRYENPHNPGDTSWNDKRKELLDDEERYEAAQKGEEPKEPKIGPPAGHPGHRRTFEGPVVFHDTPPCPVCGTVECATPLSKTMLDFDGDSRHMSYTRHAGSGGHLDPLNTRTKCRGVALWRRSFGIFAPYGPGRRSGADAEHGQEGGPAARHARLEGRRA